MTALSISPLWALFACAGARPAKSDEWVARLRTGMSKEEVVTALGPPRGQGKFSLAADYYFFIASEAVPYGLLRTLPEGAETWRYPYWVSATDQRFLCVYFSEGGEVLGWVKAFTLFSEEKYKHEKLTSKLSLRMSEEQVRRLLGSAEGFAKPPQWREIRERRELYADHYWMAPFYQADADMWVYSYNLPSGNRRKVYLLWAAGKLYGWGYDQAHEEAERYLQQKARK